MAYKITVQDGPVTITVETDVADDAAAVLAVSVLQKVQRSKFFDPPKPPAYWSGPDQDRRMGGVPPGYPPGTILCNTHVTAP